MTKYIIRFDDVCSTMNWSVWDAIEPLLDKYDVKPIVATVPDNLDQSLIQGQHNPFFWDRVRTWYLKGWGIAMHGYDHVYVTGESGIMGLNNRSEFSGLDMAIQLEKIRSSAAIFTDNGLSPKIWVAPAHSFDNNTLLALNQFGINVISDGFFLRPGLLGGNFWIPQQLWRFRYLPFGCWTICLHPINFTLDNISEFDYNLSKYGKLMVSPDSVIEEYKDRKIDFFDRLFSVVWKFLIKVKRVILLRI